MIFLRWGIFGILTFAAIFLVYNSSKRLAARHEKAAVVAAQAAPAAPETAADDSPRTPIVVACEIELTVAQHAIDARRNGDPLDRLLRTREIAFEDDVARRERLSRIARRWFEDPATPDSAELRRVVYSECDALRRP